MEADEYQICSLDRPWETWESQWCTDITEYLKYSLLHRTLVFLFYLSFQLNGWDQPTYGGQSALPQFNRLKQQSYPQMPAKLMYKITHHITEALWVSKINRDWARWLWLYMIEALYGWLWDTPWQLMALGWLTQSCLTWYFLKFELLVVANKLCLKNCISENKIDDLATK